MHKRKHRNSFRGGDWEHSAHTTGMPHVRSTFNAGNPNSTTPDSCLYIQAYEAEVIRGPPAICARSLEYQARPLMTAIGSNSRSGLIQWGPQESSEAMDAVDTQRSNQPLLWVDRYDIRLLLDYLPDSESEEIRARPELLSPSGWSDLPSDSEDAFFFAPDELEDYHREKRRRLINHDQEERLRLRVLTAVDDQENPDSWGGSDEEPDETQRELIRRTASHITSSPNPAQLEMRILANYGTDERFAFLRGRWSRAWKTEKARAKQHWVEEAKKTQPPITFAPLGRLANYGDSDSEELVDGLAEESEGIAGVSHTEDSGDNEDVMREARRARAREWSAQCLAKKSQQPDQT